jgi:hypothetical protein
MDTHVEAAAAVVRARAVEDLDRVDRYGGDPRSPEPVAATSSIRLTPSM